jgi:hypothetical protein
MAEICADRSRSNCPIKRDAQDAVRHGGETLKAMRKLRRDIKHCPNCADYGDCPMLAEFNATVDRLILELQEEWGLK